jgi:outer membrane protein assembly factor BamB
MNIAAAALALVLACAPQTTDKTGLNEELWNAARAGDVARVAKALDNGAEINSGNRYKATALFFAADKGHVEVIKLLLERGADVNALDSFYKFRPLMMALMNNHTPAAALLLERGSEGAVDALMMGIQRKNVPLVTAALGSKAVTSANLRTAMGLAKRDGTPEMIALLEKKIASMPAEAAAPEVTVDPAALKSYAGTYRNDNATMTVTLKGDQLLIQPQGAPQAFQMIPSSETAFTIAEAPGVAFAFVGRGGMIERLTVTPGSGQVQSYPRVTDAAAPSAPSAPSASVPSAPSASVPARAAHTPAKPWPAFRGYNAAGNGDGQGAVTEWSVDNGKNVRWKTPIPGFTTASPIVWGTKVFAVTAISSKGDKTFRTGLYGDVAPVEDLSEHTWKIYCLDKATGKILWERTAHVGVPNVKRHPKSTQANSTPVTDGTRVVALFGTIGVLAAWDMDGKPLWKADVGVLDSGWFFDSTYQWGHSSSPIIHDGKVIVQADVYKNSFIAAYDVKTGKPVWKTDRDAISSWGTPTVFNGNQIVTNGPTVRAYDPETGKVVWTLGPNSEVTVGTPVVGDGLIYITGGYPPVRPIYAVRPTGTGDISLPKDKTSSEVIAWSNTAGTYIPTPIYYDGILYTCGNDGVLTAYDGKTGVRIFRARVGGGGSFSASPIAADGKLYFSNEDGDIIVVRAGRQYEQLAKNSMKEVIMSTPAISDGLIVVRTLGHVYGIGEK